MSGIYLIDEAGDLVEMNADDYAKESDFQRLLADFPRLLAGDELDPNDPPRWLLVRREAPIPDSDSGKARWAVDHLFLDQHAIPTLVEVKRSADTRIRREVVGQMLDYAANAVAYWPLEQIQADLKSQCAKAGLDPDSEIMRILDDEGDVESYWQSVKTNLQAGRIRMVFVADAIPTELRTIVEFLNEQMDPAEVVAIEIKRYSGQGVTAVVPRLIGRTADSQRRKSTGGKATQWTKESFFAALSEQRSSGEVANAHAIQAWANSQGLRVVWGRGTRVGSMSPKLDVDGVAHTTMNLWSDGGVTLCFGAMKRPFDSEELRRNLLERLNTITTFGLADEDIDKWPSRKLAALSGEGDLEKFFGAWGWYIHTLRSQ